MSVFGIRHDTKFQHLGFLKEQDGQKFPWFRGQPVSASGIEIPIALFTEDFMELGVDFPHLLSSGVLVCSKKAWNVLKPLIGDSVEAFQLNSQEGEFYALNVLEIVDCLDYSRSSIDHFKSGNIASIPQMVFKTGYTDNKPIFKIPERLLTDIYVSHEFKDIIEQNRLKGLRFYEVKEQ